MKPCTMATYFGVQHLNNRTNLDQASEMALMEQCRRQDFEAFGKLVDLYQSRIIGFIKRMVRNSEEAEDISQEVFIRAFQNLSKFDGRSSLRTWLFRIAYNLCVDSARKKGRYLPDSGLVDSETDEVIEISDPKWNPETVILDEEMRAVIEGSVGTLSDKLRTVLLLHDKEELGYIELSEMLAIPVGTVKSRLFLARQHVQQDVEKYLQGGN